MGAVPLVATAHCEPDSTHRVSGTALTWLESRARSAFTRRAARATDRVVAVSRNVLEALASHGVPAGKMVVIHSGIQLPEGPCPEPRTRPPTEAGVVGSVCRLEAVKGLGHLVDAAALLRSRALGARFAVWGEGGEEERLRAPSRLRGWAGRSSSWALSRIVTASSSRSTSTFPPHSPKG